MGYYVHLHVVIDCGESPQLAALARTHEQRLSDWASLEHYLDPDAWRLLTDLGQREAPLSPGPKGDLTLWGYVGNYTNVERFVTQLTPFFRDLFSMSRDRPAYVSVFAQEEQTETARLVQIRPRSHDDPTNLEVREFYDLPFSLYL